MENITIKVGEGYDIQFQNIVLKNTVVTRIFKEGDSTKIEWYYGQSPIHDTTGEFVYRLKRAVEINNATELQEVTI